MSEGRWFYPTSWPEFTFWFCDWFLKSSVGILTIWWAKSSVDFRLIYQPRFPGYLASLTWSRRLFIITSRILFSSKLLGLKSLILGNWTSGLALCRTEITSETSSEIIIFKLLKWRRYSHSYRCKWSPSCHFTEFREVDLSVSIYIQQSDHLINLLITHFLAYYIQNISDFSGSYISVFIQVEQFKCLFDLFVSEGSHS